MCDPGVPKLAERITNESGRAHETEPESLKKADKKIQNKRQYKNEYSQSANERPTKVLARERQRQREREREREMEVRDKTAADRAFLCTGITASRDREHKGILLSEPECGVWMNETRRHQIARPCVRE